MAEIKLSPWAVFKEYLIITIGLLTYVLGWAVFLIPNNLVGGGVSGIGAILYYATGFPMGYTYFAVNFILLAISLKVLGGGFGFKTVYAIIFASVMLNILPPLIPESITQELAVSNGKLLCTIIGGAMNGLGIGLTMSQGGSTGGTDIIALMVTKFRNSHRCDHHPVVHDFPVLRFRRGAYSDCGEIGDIRLRSHPYHGERLCRGSVSVRLEAVGTGVHHFPEIRGNR